MKEDKSKYDKFRVKTKLVNYKCPKCNSTWELVEPICPVCDRGNEKLGIPELNDN